MVVKIPLKIPDPHRDPDQHQNHNYLLLVTQCTPHSSTTEKHAYGKNITCLAEAKTL